MPVGSGAAPAYDALGPVGAPAVVLVHATRLSRASWKPQADRLAGEFRVILPDLPGHGALADVPFTLAGAAETLARIIDEAAGGRAVVCGLSLGGYVAMELAARTPERVAGLVLAGAAREPVGVWSLPYRVLVLAFSLLPESALARFQSWLLRRRHRPSIVEPIIAGGFYFRGGARAVRTLIGERFRPRLARYPGPTLILNGQFDLFFRLAESGFARVAADPHRIVIRGAGHQANVDQPEAFTAAIREFSASCR